MSDYYRRQISNPTKGLGHIPRERNLEDVVILELNSNQSQIIRFENKNILNYGGDIKVSNIERKFFHKYSKKHKKMQKGIKYWGSSCSGITLQVQIGSQVYALYRNFEI